MPRSVTLLLTDIRGGNARGRWHARERKSVCPFRCRENDKWKCSRRNKNGHESLNYHDSYCPDTEANPPAQKELRVLSINKIRTIAPGMDSPRNTSYPPSFFFFLSSLRFFRTHPFFHPQRPPVCFIASRFLLFFLARPTGLLFSRLPSALLLPFFPVSPLLFHRSNDLAHVFHDLVLIYSGFKRATFSANSPRHFFGISMKLQATGHFRWIDTISGTHAAKTRIFVSFF